jgi:type III secretion protein L
MSANGNANGQAAAPSRPLGPIVKAAEAESWVDGFAFRDRAKREADALLADMQAAYERRRQDGFEQGRREGAAAAAELLATTSARVDRYLAGIEGELVELALGVLRRLVGEFDQRELVARLAREAIESFRREQSLTVTVAPENVEIARAHFREQAEAGRQVAVESDPKLGAFDCRVESPYATVDAGLDAQIESVRRELTEPSGGDQ